MTVRIIIILALNFLAACSHRGQDYYKPEYSVVMSRDKGEGLVKSGSRQSVDDYEEFFDLSEQEVQILEENFKKITREEPTGCCFEGQGIRKLEEYGYQYVGVTINNEKFIYINAFLLPDFRVNDPYRPDWTKQIIMSNDGGNAYWGVLFNLRTKEFERLAINGTA